MHDPPFLACQCPLCEGAGATLQAAQRLATLLRSRLALPSILLPLTALLGVRRAATTIAAGAAAAAIDAATCRGADGSAVAPAAAIGVRVSFPDGAGRTARGGVAAAVACDASCRATLAVQLAEAGRIVPQLLQFRRRQRRRSGPAGGAAEQARVAAANSSVLHFIGQRLEEDRLDRRAAALLGSLHFDIGARRSGCVRTRGLAGAAAALVIIAIITAMAGETRAGDGVGERRPAGLLREPRADSSSFSRPALQHQCVYALKQSTDTIRWQQRLGTLAECHARVDVNCAIRRALPCRGSEGTAVGSCNAAEGGRCG